MHVELSTAEYRIVVAALERYRIAKSAEKMLTAHKQKTPEAVKEAMVPYDKLLAVLTVLQGRLSAPQEPTTP